MDVRRGHPSPPRLGRPLQHTRVRSSAPYGRGPFFVYNVASSSARRRTLYPWYGSNLHFHVVAGDAHLVGGYVFPGRKHFDLPRPDVEAGAVPGALDLVFLDAPLAQGSAHMGAGVVERVDLTPQIEQGDPVALDLDVGTIVLGEPRFPGNFDESAHGDPSF